MSVTRSQPGGIIFNHMSSSEPVGSLNSFPGAPRLRGSPVFGLDHSTYPRTDHVQARLFRPGGLAVLDGFC
jgi:hypothetical protein